MKILICGKGGSGKSTLSVLIATALKNRGYKVLLVDADESNVGLHHLLGISSPVTLMDTLGGKKGAKNKMVKRFSGESPFVNEKWTIKDIPDDCLNRMDGMKLLIIGKIRHFGEGCACSMGVTAKTFLSNLTVGEDEMVLVDTEAGIEHFGRRVEEGCDMILGITDPVYESFMLAEKIEEMAQKAGTPVRFVLNKVEEAVETVMTRHIDPEKVIAKIPRDNSIFMDSLEGRKLGAQILEMDHICQFVEDFKHQ